MTTFTDAEAARLAAWDAIDALRDAADEEES